eukprot:m.275850 g.275850  ORF g.275850 m.275850 type:complete len:481 (-) comp11099_c0_seq15:249-1691(-)
MAAGRVYRVRCHALCLVTAVLLALMALAASGAPHGCPSGTVAEVHAQVAHCVCPPDSHCAGPRCATGHTPEGEERSGFHPSCSDCRCLARHPDGSADGADPEQAVDLCVLRADRSTRDTSATSGGAQSETTTWTLITSESSGAASRATRTARPRCRGEDLEDAVAQGEWRLPCSTDLAALERLSATSAIPTPMRWEAAGCELARFEGVSPRLAAMDSLPLQDVDSCVDERLLLFVGDSVLRGLLETLMLVCETSTDPAEEEVFEDYFQRRHERFHVNLPACRTEAFFDYYFFQSPSHRIVESPWELNKAARVGPQKAGMQFADHLHSVARWAISELGPEEFARRRVLLHIGGMNSHSIWLEWLDKYLREPSSLLHDQYREGKLEIVFKGDHMSRRYDGHEVTSPGKNQGMRKTLARLFPRAMFIDPTPLERPFYPDLTTADKCSCHLQYVTVKDSGLSVRGAGNAELSNIYLNTICPISS